MSDSVHSEIYKGRMIVIAHDSDTMDPRAENDNATTMVCHHGRYSLGDKHDHGNSPIVAINSVIESLTGENPDCDTFADVYDALNDSPCFYRMLYLYDHSGITISTSPFSCPWDSGTVGFVFISYADAKKNFNWSDESFVPNDEQLKLVHELIEAEVAEYDNYLRGECYGYKVYESENENENELEEACWGFLGDYNYCLGEAKGLVDAIVG